MHPDYLMLSFGSDGSVGFTSLFCGPYDYMRYKGQNNI